MRNEEIESRLHNLEANMMAVLHRLSKIEEHLSPDQMVAEVSPEPVSSPVMELPAAIEESPRISTGPPPIIAVQDLIPIDENKSWRPLPEIPEYKWQSSPEENRPAASAPAPPPINPPTSPRFTLPDPPSADDIEYKFGINGLLRGGAAVVVIAILLGVAIMVGRGAITPPVQYAGEIALCLAFIGFGIKKRDEREDFGQLMVGIGSFGLYASFAAGYAYKHLYEGEPLVAMYMLLSLANLGYAFWRSSKSFLTIGMLGGLVAAMMPMHKDKVFLDFVLHFLILFPCAAIIVRNKWNGMAGLMWVVSTAALIPATTSHFEQIWRVGATYLNCAIALYACGKVFKPSEFDKHAAIQTVMLVLTGFFAIAIDTGHKGSLHAIALTIIAAGIGYAIRENEKARNATWLGGLIVFSIIIPIGFTQNVASFIYGIEALALILLAIRYQLVAVWAVSLATFIFSIVSYLYFPDKNIVSLARFSAPLELFLLAISSTTVALNIRYALPNKIKEIQDGAMFLGGILLVAFFVRALNVVLGNGNTSLHIGAINTLGLSLASLAIQMNANRFQRFAVFLLGSLTALTSFLFYLVASPDGKLSFVSVAPALDLILIAIFASAVWLSVKFVLHRTNKDAQEFAIFFGGGFLVASFVRTSNILLATSSLAPTVITLVSTAIGSAAVLALSNRYPRLALYLLGTGTLFVSALFYFVPLTDSNFEFARMTPSLELFLLATYASAICLNVRYVLRNDAKNEQELALFLGGSLLVALFIRSINILLGHGNTTLQVNDINSLGIGLAALTMTLVGARTKRKGLLIASAILGFWVGTLALLLEPEIVPHWMSPVLILLAAGCVLVGSKVLIQGNSEQYQESVMTFAGVAMSAFFVRIMHLVGINHLLNLTKETATYFSLGLLSLVWIGFALRDRRIANLILAWASFIIAASAGGSLPTSTVPDWLSPVLLAIPIVSLCILYIITPRKDRDEGTLTTLCVIPGWFLSTMFLRQELLRPWIGLNNVASFTAAWVIFAVFLITAGFRGERRFLRYWALGVFGVTVAKVFLVDLAELDSVIRFAMLALLGTGMMGGGYWYILWRRSHNSKTSGSDDSNPQ